VHVDVLVFAPHPDDEVIGCTGVIMQAIEQNRKVAVVVITNGDGFPKGTAAITGKAKEALTAADFLELAELRQRQSFQGINRVGLKASDISFLSYPDGGLAAIYQSEEDTPFLQMYTGKSETYGLVAKDYHTAKHGRPAPYTRASIIGDLAEIIRGRKPKEIYVTNELDQHSDHRAAMWFVRDAAAMAGYEGELYTFLVHGKKRPEAAPHRVSLTPEQIAVKKAAIGMHRIPKVHDHLVEAHAKDEELFWLIPLAGEVSVLPQIEGDWWQVAGNPDLGEFTSPKQEPVDFGVWQAADGTWQLWSCIRKTNCGGNTRLFHGWEGQKLTDKNWNPLGIMMQGDPKYGESVGGMQAPHVIRHEGTYYMFYGDWANICMATSKDGKKFTRVVQENGKTGMFNEGDGEHARDPMILKVGERFHCYYTAHSVRSPEKNHRGVNYCCISPDLRDWGKSQVIAQGSAYGKGPYCAECPHVVFHPESKHYYLFNTQRYGKRNHTTVFRSTDPLAFGINDSQLEVATLPVAAPEVILHEGQYYIASLKPSLDGIQLARLKWVTNEE